jgi:hypothetical protein
MHYLSILLPVAVRHHDKNLEEVAAEIKEATEPSREDVQRLAYDIYESEGRCDGQDIDHWAQAEAQLTASRLHDVSLRLTTDRMAEQFFIFPTQHEQPFSKKKYQRDRDEVSLSKAALQQGDNRSRKKDHEDSPDFSNPF